MDPKFIAMALTVLSAFVAIPAACVGLTTALYNPPDLPMRPAPIWETTPTPKAVHRGHTASSAVLCRRHDTDEHSTSNRRG